MAQYGYPPVGPPKPPVSGGDIAVSVTALILTVVLGSWPIAVATLALCTITVFLGGVGYVLAVG